MRLLKRSRPRAPEPDPARWIVVHEEPLQFRWIKCLDGIWWHGVPAPPRGHECRAQTKGWMTLYVERCACGAIRHASAPPADGEAWRDRNSRRKAAT